MLPFAATRHISTYGTRPSLLLALLLVMGCASQRPPEGGPADTEAPTIVESVPPDGSTRFNGQEVTLQFSEYVQRQSFQEAIHISPLPPEPPVYEWSGKEVTIIFPDSLLPDRTYVITVGTKIRDVRASNPMAATFHLAFSTGDSLDRGSFNGTVLDDNPGGVSIFAYLLTPERADTLNPAVERPDYLVQSAEDGSFHFYNTAPGLYRVFAVRDKSNNMRYDVESDAIGVPSGDILVQDSLPPEPPLRFLLSTEDTTRPSVQRIEALSAHRIRVKFNETVYPQPLPLQWLHVSDSLSGNAATVVAAMAPANEHYAWDLYMADPLPDALMLFMADSLVDGAGNMVDIAEGGLTFPGSIVGDTTRPIVASRFPTPRAKNIPPDSAIVLSFDRPMQQGFIASLKDSTGVEVPLTPTWITSNELRLSHPPLLDEAAYTLCVALDVLRDSIASRNVADTAYCLTFTTGIIDRFGLVAGEVRSEDSTGNFVVRLRKTGKNAKEQNTRADSLGAYRFEKVEEGTYLLDGYQDNNKNEKYDAGSAYPFRGPEPFGVVRDTLRVRARWETKGIILRVR